MAHVLFLSPYFPPDGVSTAQIMADLALDLRHAGHSVSVITAIPHHNRDGDAAARQPLHEVWGPLLRASDFRGIRVLHAWVPRRRHPFAMRLLGLLSFHTVAFMAAWRARPTPDVIIVPSPLLSVGWLGWLLGRIHGSRYIYNVQELYPDLAVELGWLKNRFLIRVLLGLEAFVYKHAFAVTAIGPGMAAVIRAKGVPAEKVHVIPNFADTEFLAPADRHNEFSRAQSLDDSFVVSYAGNMGRAQGLDVIVEAAEKMRTDEGVVFVLIGDGLYRDRLQSEARRMGLTNVMFVAHQPFAVVPQIYGSSDVCLVPLTGGLGGLAIPSKVLRIMSCGRPIIALADASSDLAVLVSDCGAGEVVPPNDPEMLVASIRRLRASAEARALSGIRGREAVRAHYSRGIVSAKYDALVRSAAAYTEAPATQALR